MLSPTTLTFSTLTLVLSERPLRAGLWFYLGALLATLAIGVVAAFVLGDLAAPGEDRERRNWVAWVDIGAGALLLLWVVRALRRPRNPASTAKMLAKIEQVTSAPAIAIVGAGAMLANPGGFIPIALKSISELDPSPAQYVVDWVFFAVVSLLPLAAGLVALVVAPEWAARLLAGARRWLERNARAIAAVLVVALAVALLRNG